MFKALDEYFSLLEKAKLNTNEHVVIDSIGSMC